MCQLRINIILYLDPFTSSAEHAKSFSTMSMTSASGTVTAQYVPFLPTLLTLHSSIIQ